MKVKYDLLLTDNPWKYDNMQQNDPARGGIPYPHLTMKELYDLPIYKAAKDDSILVYWVTFPKLIDGFYSKKEKNGGDGTGIYNPLTIIQAWGFRPVTTLFVWIKTNKRGEVIYDDTNVEEYNNFYSGLGQYTNSNAEIAIVARRGKGLPRKAKDVKQLIFAPIGSHSAKPQEQYNRLSRLYGDDIDCIELFARKQNPPPITWNATGLDYDGLDIRQWIRQYE